jgi:hypothetical protein
MDGKLLGQIPSNLIIHSSIFPGMSIMSIIKALKKGNANIAFLSQYIKELNDLRPIATKGVDLSTHDINK